MEISRLSNFYNNISKDYHEASFKAGFLHGLAEKVYIGACPAAMTVSYKDHDIEWTLLMRIASTFKLYTWSIKRSTFYEYWIFKYDFHRDLLTKNEDDNTLRAMLCGYNSEGVDLNFIIDKGK